MNKSKTQLSRWRVTCTEYISTSYGFGIEFLVNVKENVAEYVWLYGCECVLSTKQQFSGKRYGFRQSTQRNWREKNALTFYKEAFLLFSMKGVSFGVEIEPHRIFRGASKF